MINLGIFVDSCTVDVHVFSTHGEATVGMATRDLLL